MTTYIASTTAEIKAMVAAANGGDTVLLAPGTYNNVSLTGITERVAVKIGSLDPNQPAVLTGLSIRNSSGLNFSDLEVQTSKTQTFIVYGSHSISFDNIDVHGKLNGSSQDDDTNGLLIRSSSYVTVSNSHFHELLEGINHLNDQAITISDNTFNLIGNDGVAGGGSSQVTISDNTFTDFDHVGAVHPDMIQFWTTNTKTSASDITVSGNVFDRGAGAAVQGIFIQDEVGRLPYKNVTITNNTIVGANYNAIQLTHAISAFVASNVVIGTSDQPSWIGISNVSYVNFADNIATDYRFSNANINGRGDVLATVLALDADGSFPTWDSAKVVAGSAASAQAKAAIVAAVHLIGYTDGPSGLSVDYDFSPISLVGSSAAERLNAGSAGAYEIYGNGGGDLIAGNKAGVANTLVGGPGNDTYTIYQAMDVVVENANEGIDLVKSYVNYTLEPNVDNIQAMAAGLSLTGNGSNNAMTAVSGGDALYGLGGADNLAGSNSNDRLYGGDGNDRVVGNSGNDLIDGGTGNDQLYGGDGNDLLTGGAGNDYIEGGLGVDTMTGGLGADTFAYRTGSMVGTLAAKTDVIKDFNVSQGDKISLILFDANSNTTALDHFKYIGTQAFHGVAGELRWAVDGDGITVYGDTNGDKVADLAIHLTGLTTITSSSFII